MLRRAIFYYEIVKLRKRIKEPGSENGSGNHQEAIIETYLTDASTRRIEGFAESKG